MLTFGGGEELVGLEFYFALFFILKKKKKEKGMLLSLAVVYVMEALAAAKNCKSENDVPINHLAWAVSGVSNLFSCQGPFGYL